MSDDRGDRPDEASEDPGGNEESDGAESKRDISEPAAISMVLGLTIGVAIGVALDNIAIGIGIGLAIGASGLLAGRFRR